MVSVWGSKQVRNDLESETNAFKAVMTGEDSRDHSLVRKGGDQVCQGAHGRCVRNGVMLGGFYPQA